MFILVLLACITLAHGFLWWRLAHAPRWPLWVRGCVSGWLLVGLAMTATGMLGRRFFDDPPTWLVFSGYLWMGIAFYLFVIQCLLDLARTGWWGISFVRGRRAEPISPRGRDPTPAAAESTRAASTRDELATPEPSLDRRLFLARTAAVATGLAGGGVSWAGVRSARVDVTTPEVVVRLARLPRALEGFRIALLTDLHVGPVLRKAFVRQVVEQTNALRPDLVAIGGDLVDALPDDIADDLAPLLDLNARCGTVFVTGNHEFYWNALAWVEFLPKIGVRVLDNEIVRVGDRDPTGASFDFAGIHDPTGGGRRFSRSPLAASLAPDIDKIRRGRDESRELLLLAHQPKQIIDAVQAGAGLQLSGHTHGGQLWPFGALVQRAQPYIAGLHRHTAQTQIYVSRGVGFWGPPMRVLAPAEITSIVLVLE